MKRLVLGVFLSLTVLACSGPSAKVKEQEQLTTQEHPNYAFDIKTPVGQEMVWALDTINGAERSDEDFKSHFTTRFLNAVPLDDFKPSIDDIASKGPYEIAAVLVEEDASIVLELHAPSGNAEFSLAINDADKPQIDGLFLKPIPKAGLEAGSELETQSQWLIEALNGPPLSGEALAEHFNEEFLSHVPAEALSPVFNELQALAPVHIEKAETAGEETAILTVAGAQGARMLIYLTIDPEQPGILAGLGIRPAPSDEPLPASWEEILLAMQKDMAKAQIYVGRIDPTTGTCSEEIALGSPEPLPIGSSFKLFILGALAREIAAEQRSWEDPITIEERFKSYPSGVLQDEEAGTQFTTQEVAAKMISISDNTATDHLLHLLGREAVEAYMGATGHSKPALNTPMLSTKDLFVFKLDKDDLERQTYIDASVDERRALLAQVLEGPLPPIERTESWTAPKYIENFEWYASGADLCGVAAEMVSHHDEAAYQPLFEILAINGGGLVLDSEQWTYLGFKGGSEPGVMHLGYLLQRADGQWFYLSLNWSDAENAFPLGARTPTDMAAAAAALLQQ